MQDQAANAKRWREIAQEVRWFAADVRSPAAKAELLGDAANWEKRAAEAEATALLVASAD